MIDFYKTVQTPMGWFWEQLQSFAPNVGAMKFLNPKSLSRLALVAQVVVSLDVGKADFDVFDYVDPLIGTANGGKIG